MKRRLSEGEERALFHEYARAGSLAIRNEIIDGHAWLVALVSREYRCSEADRADLLGEGTLGLFVAFERFDPMHGVRFATYARYWVQAAMAAHLRRATSALGSLPHARARRRGSRDVSLDAPLSSDGDETLLDRLAAETTDVDGVIERGRLVEVVADVVTTFDARERRVFEARFVAREAESDDLAKTLALSRARVRQLEERVRTKLVNGLVAFQSRSSSRALVVVDTGRATHAST